MKRAARVVALAAGVCVFFGNAAAEEPLLPKEYGNAKREEWKAVSAVHLESVAGDLAPLLREYGAKTAEQALYRITDLPYRQMRLTVYTMEDRSGAYGAFTVLRSNAQPIGIGEGGVLYWTAEPTEFAAQRFLFYQGNCLVKVEGLVAAHGTEVWLRDFAQQLGARNHKQESLPSLPDYLPEGYIAGSDAYVLGPVGLARVAPLAPGDWAGFAYGAEVEVARYQRNGGEAHLLLLSYPTPQIARARLADFQQLFNLNLEGRANAPVAFAKRDRSLIILVAGLDSREAAEQLISQVRYQPQMSLSDAQPEDLGTTVRGLFNLMPGTVLLVLLTLALSLAFSGFRLGVKFWFPGRYFDRLSEEEGLYLDLRPRR